MITLTRIDLENDGEAKRFVKNEVVAVTFATEVGSIESREGANRYSVGDALITGSTDDRWSVTRNRFDAKYEPVHPLVHGQDGSYRNRPIPVLAKQVRESFAISRSSGGDLIRGNAGDWVLQYAPGDYGIVEDRKFQTVYRSLPTD